MSRRPHRASYLAIGFAMNLMLGSAYAWSVFTGPLKVGFGATDFGAMAPLAVSLATFSVAMVFAGRLVDRHGPRKVAVLGGVLVGGGYLMSSTFHLTPWPLATLTLSYGVVVGLGLGFAYNPPIPTAIRWFPDRKGLASGVVVMGFGLSALLTAPLADFLIANHGVPTAFLVLGLAFLAGLVALGSLLAFPPADWQAPSPRTRVRRTWTPLADVGTAAMVRSPAFWSVWILYALGTAGGFMVIGKAKPIAEEVALVSGVLAVAAVQVLAVFNSLGRPLFGRLVDRWGPKRTLVAMYLVLLGAMCVLAVSSSFAILVAGIALTGLVFGGFLAVMPGIATFFFGTRHLGANYGVLFTGYGAGAIVALFAIGPIRDAFGTYVPAFYVGLALSGVGLALALQVRPPKRVATRRVPWALTGAGPARTETAHRSPSRAGAAHRAWRGLNGPVDRR